MSCDNENGQIGGESLTKYQRSDDVHNSSLVSHEQISSLPSSQTEQQQSGSQADSLSGETLPSGSVMGTNGHFVGDNSRSSPLLSSSGAETYPKANRVASPNSLPPTEFKQESHSVAVSCDGGRTVRTASRDSLSNGLGLASGRSSTENKSADPGVGQDLQTQLKDFERVLMSYTNSDMFKNAGMPSMNSEISPQHHQISRPTQPQMDARETINVQQQNSSVPNQATGQKNPYPTPPSQGPPGALHLQHLARQAQSQRAQAVSGYMDGQEQDASQQFRSQQMQFMNSIRFAVSGSQPQMPNQNTNQPAQLSASGRFRGSLATGADQFGNMYSSKDQNHNVIMSTGFASNTTQSLQYQRMMQSQAQQQALYSRLNQQQSMSQRLSHPSIQEHQQSSYQQYPTQVSMSQTVPQVNNMSMQNLPPYTNSGYQNMQSSQTPFQRQLSMPLPGQAYTDQYAQQMNQYSVGDQQVPSQPQPQQTDMSSTAYHYNRRNSFPLYHHSMNQPVASYGPPGTPYPGQVNQMRNSIPPGQNPANAMVDGRANSAAGYNYNNRTTGFPTQSGLQGLMQMPQRNRPSMTHSGAMPPSRPDQQNMAYSANIRDSNTQNISQEMKYPTRNEVPKVTRAQSFSDPLALGDPTSNTNSDTNYNPFSPLGTLEKAPSFASLLEQSSGSLNNLETTYTGSIPNLDLLGEIIG